jgi:hypothetical protein
MVGIVCGILVVTTLYLGTHVAVYRKSEQVALGGSFPTTYRQNLSFPWESQVTIQVDSLTGWIYGFFWKREWCRLSLVPRRMRDPIFEREREL